MVNIKQGLQCLFIQGKQSLIDAGQIYFLSCYFLHILQNITFFSDLFYVRNHLPVPDIDESSYELEICDELMDKEQTFTLENIKKYPKHTVTAAIQCAGNRRSEMTKVSGNCHLWYYLHIHPTLQSWCIHEKLSTQRNSAQLNLFRCRHPLHNWRCVLMEKNFCPKTVKTHFRKQKTIYKHTFDINLILL